MRAGVCGTAGGRQAGQRCLGWGKKVLEPFFVVQVVPAVRWAWGLSPPHEAVMRSAWAWAGPSIHQG